jgi:hypothetical protein
MSMSHSQPHPVQLARWNAFPDMNLGITGVVTNGRCWHRSTDCQRYRATTNRGVAVGPVKPMTARQARDQGWGLCSKCA